jgi:hypothetical protein
MKYNPFRPNSMVGPTMFTGRVEELRAVEQSLFQTKNGNPHHFLIQGERGIGKSSLFFYVEITASGKITTLQGDRLNFLTISLDLNGCTTQLDVVRAFGRGLRRALSDKEALREGAKQVWEFLKNWEVLGVSYRGDETASDIEDARDSLVDRVAEFCQRAGAGIDGIVILVDEADSPSSDAQLGEFVKLFTERLVRRDCNNVLLGMAGLPSIIGTLKKSHESSPRIFEIYSLQPLEPDERRTVVQRGLAEAAEKNGFATQITPDALYMICELSEGYPHFVQQFAFSAFAEDNDNTIDVADVTGGAYKENGALAQLGNKYFNEMYHAKIYSEDYRRVLDAMASYGDGWVSRGTLIKETSVSESSVGNALSSLKDKKIILQDESRRGFYRLPTKSFAAWINAIKASRAKNATLTDSLFGEKPK